MWIKNIITYNFIKCEIKIYKLVKPISPFLSEKVSNNIKQITKRKFQDTLNKVKLN